MNFPQATIVSVLKYLIRATTVSSTSYIMVEGNSTKPLHQSTNQISRNALLSKYQSQDEITKSKMRYGLTARI